MGIINKIGNAISEIFADPPPFDPSTLNDPIALKTSWKPLVPGGFSLPTRRMEIQDDHTFKILPSLLSYTIPVAILVAATVGVYQAVIEMMENVKGAVQELLAITAIGGAIGVIWLIRLRKLRVMFDKRTNTFYKQSMGSGLFPFGMNTSLTPLDDIHAIQIINELVTGSKNSYHSYELNVILKNGTRINVQDHGGLNQTLHSAEALSEFLQVPLWDASDYEV